MANLALTAALSSSIRTPVVLNKEEAISGRRRPSATTEPRAIPGKKNTKSATVSNADATNAQSDLYGQLWASGRQRPQSDLPPGG